MTHPIENRLKQYAICACLFLASCHNNVSEYITPQCTPRIDNVYLAKVTTDNNSTTLWIDTYCNNPQWKFALPTTTALIANGDTLPINHSEGLEIGETRSFVDNIAMRTKLTFPALPDSLHTLRLWAQGEHSAWLNIDSIHLQRQPLQQAPIVCHIEGVATGNSENLGFLLLPANADPSFVTMPYIPLFDGSFSYTLTTDEEQRYTLISAYTFLLRSMFYSYTFVAENDTLQCTVTELDKYAVTGNEHLDVVGGTITEQYLALKHKAKEVSGYKKFEDACNQLAQRGKAVTEAFAVWLEELRKAEAANNKELYDSLRRNIPENIYTPEYDSIYNGVSMKEHQQALMEQTKNQSLASLYVLEELLSHEIYRIRSKGDIERLNEFRKIYNHYHSTRYRHTSAARYIGEILESLVTVGTKYNDFSAPDTDGKQYTLSQLIDGKTAILDVWGSWCGSCRRHTNNVIKPLYEKYKEKGLVVVGIASEYNSTNNLKAALSNEKWQWLNLVDLDGAIKVWDIYGAGSILIDRNGKILANGSPTFEYLDSIIAKEL